MDISKVVNIFTQAEESKFSLLNLINELSCEIERWMMNSEIGVVACHSSTHVLKNYIFGFMCDVPLRREV